MGPELTDAGVAAALLDPMLDLYDSSGNLLKSNDNWATPLKAKFRPQALLRPIRASEQSWRIYRAGAYTAIVSGVNGATGVALVEVYHVP